VVSWTQLVHSRDIVGPMSGSNRPLPKREVAPRIALAGLILLAVGFFIAAVIWSDLAAANNRDLAINDWFWSFGQTHPVFLASAQSISWVADGPRNIAVVTLISLGLLLTKQWRWALFLVLVSQVGVLISNLLKFSIARERPPFIEDTDFQQHLSFPSGHTFAGFTVWTAIALITWYLMPRRFAPFVALVCVIIGILQAPSRLLVGKHWVTDVVGSWLLGAGWLLMVWAAFLWWWAPRNTNE
jgi:membrane-associated phospholipid phosphatase